MAMSGRLSAPVPGCGAASRPLPIISSKSSLKVAETIDLTEEDEIEILPSKRPAPPARLPSPKRSRLNAPNGTPTTVKRSNSESPLLVRSDGGSQAAHGSAKRWRPAWKKPRLSQPNTLPPPPIPRPSPTTAPNATAGPSSSQNTPNKPQGNAPSVKAMGGSQYLPSQGAARLSHPSYSTSATPRSQRGPAPLRHTPRHNNAMPVLSMELRGSGTQTDAIVLDSDDEAIAPIAVYNSTRATPAADNSDEDINDWVDSWYNHLLSPVPVPTERPAPVSNLQSNLSGLSLRETVPPERPTIPRGPNPFEGYDWSQAGNVPWVPPVNGRSRLRPRFRRRHLMVDPYNQTRPSACSARSPHKATLLGLRLAGSIKIGDGSITKVLQRGNRIVISSATAGGEPDEPHEVDEEPNAYNTSGNLVLLEVRRDADSALAPIRHDLIQESPTDPPRGHVQWRSGIKTLPATDMLTGSRPIELRYEWSKPKYYTVNDVAFHPVVPNRLVSCANDGFVCTWDLGTMAGSIPVQMDRVKLPATPQDLHFRPDSARLAITCSDGRVRMYGSDTGDPLNAPLYSQVRPKTFPIARYAQGHSAGSATWGREGTDDVFFVSTEPLPGTVGGRHKAFDESGSELCTFSGEEAGDSLAIHPRGTELAMVTIDERDVHRLRIFPVELEDRENRVEYATNSVRTAMTPAREATQATALETPIRREKRLDYPALSSASPQLADESGEVNVMSYSPDGLYLALARSDDIVEVYDPRDLSRGALYVFEHPHVPVPVKDHYGVFHMEWVGDLLGPLSLVTSGADGKVRLWDMTKGSRLGMNGQVIASVPHDIGYCSLGDVSKGELPLVVGDIGGTLYLFDRPRS